MVTPADLKSAIRNVPDFPKQGIMFRDITTLLRRPESFQASIDALTEIAGASGATTIAGIESRGFIFAAAVADRLGCGLVPMRKPGKLPAASVRQEYKLEYGTDALEVHADAITESDAVLIIDDLLATGGTAAAACQLVRKLGGRVAGLAFLVELSFLHGRNRLAPDRVWSVVTYDSE